MSGHSANAAVVAVLSKPDNISLLEEVALKTFILQTGFGKRLVKPSIDHSSPQGTDALHSNRKQWDFTNLLH